jgi:hypothetical protein
MGDAADQRETVVCAKGVVCGSESYGPDHHGWDCPLSDPLGDCLRALGPVNANPILEGVRRKMMADFGVTVEPLDASEG